MRIYAHRGSSGTLPENTLRAFEQALADGADGVEFDVRATADGVPVVIHDRGVERTTNGQGNVDELTLAELREFDAGGGQAVPTLVEALDLLAGRIPLAIEMKQPGIEREVLDVLAGYPRAEWVILSFHWDVLQTVRRLAPTAEVWPLAVAPDDPLFAVAAELPARAVSLLSTSATAEVAQRCRDAGLGLIVWTVNDVEEARRVRDIGAAAAASDLPALIRQGLASDGRN